MTGHSRQPGPVAKPLMTYCCGPGRCRPHRPSFAQACQAQANGSLLIDIRGDDQRRVGGLIPGAIVVARNSLQWRCDPACAWRHPALTSRDVHLILFCQQGYQSSLAAATLQQLGLIHATDLDGGFAAWAMAGFPVAAPATGHPRALADPGGPEQDPACSRHDPLQAPHPAEAIPPPSGRTGHGMQETGHESWHIHWHHF